MACAGVDPEALRKPDLSAGTSRRWQRSSWQQQRRQRYLHRLYLAWEAVRSGSLFFCRQCTASGTGLGERALPSAGAANAKVLGAPVRPQLQLSPGVPPLPRAMLEAELGWKLGETLAEARSTLAENCAPVSLLDKKRIGWERMLRSGMRHQIIVK